MGTLTAKDTALLVHIEHSKPIEMTEFVTSLNALNRLYASYAKANGESKDETKSKLYVEKIEHGSIDIYLCELAASAIIPFVENTNIILEFAGYVKNVYEYFTKGKGEKPKLAPQECNNFKDVLNIVASDNQGTMSIGAVSKTGNGDIFNNCTFNFGESNSAQNQLTRLFDEVNDDYQDEIVHNRVLMQIYQIRNDINSVTGNKAVIDSIFKGKKLALLFESDELKKQMLFSETNPTQKAFQVDVVVQTLNDIPRAYKVVALHEVIDIPN